MGKIMEGKEKINATINRIISDVEGKLLAAGVEASVAKGHRPG
jgi:hypothetical protein